MVKVLLSVRWKEAAAIWVGDTDGSSGTAMVTMDIMSFLGHVHGLGLDVYNDVITTLCAWANQAQREGWPQGHAVEATMLSSPTLTPPNESDLPPSSTWN